MITKTCLQGLADRVAAQKTLLAAAITSANVTGNGLFYPRVHAGVPAADGDFRTENDLIDSAYNLDTAKLVDSNIYPDIYRDFINDLNSHAANVGKTDLNTLLSGLNLNVSIEFDDVYYQVRAAHLWGENVYSSGSTVMGSVAFSGSGVSVFTDGSAMGSGYHAATSATNRAAAMVHAVPATLIGGTNVILDVRYTNENDVAQSVQVTIPAGTAIGTLISVGTSGTTVLRDVTNVVGAGGTNGDYIVLRSTHERIPAL